MELPNEIWFEIIKASNDLFFMKRLSTISKGFRSIYDKFVNTLEREGNKLVMHRNEIVITGAADTMGLPNYQCKDWRGNIDTCSYIQDNQELYTLSEFVQYFRNCGYDYKDEAYRILSQLYPEYATFFMLKRSSGYPLPFAHTCGAHHSFQFLKC